MKTHLRILFQRFGLDDLPQNEKRAELVRQALETGAVSSADLRRPEQRPALRRKGWRDDT